MNKKKLSRWLCLVLAMLMLFSACGKKESAPAEETAQEQVQETEKEPAETETPDKETVDEETAEEPVALSDTLRVAMSSDVMSWDIRQFPDGDARFVWNQIYDTLVRLDADMNMVPGLATEWTQSEDGMTWTFKLREGVTFHDGTPFTADAVLFSYNDETYVRSIGTLPVSEIVKVDDYTVDFVCTKACPLPTYLTHVAWPIASPTIWDAEGNFVAPVGTGPYKFVSHTKGEEIVVEKNESYWGDAAQTQNIAFKVIPDAASRVLALRSGDVDMCLKIAESDAATMMQEDGLVVHHRVSTFTDYLQFNTKKAPFDDINVRQAVAWAVDTEAIVANALDGIGVAAQGRAYSPIMMYSADDLELFSVDLEKSKALLAESGWADSNGDGILEKNGEDLEVSFILGQSWSPREIRIMQIVQAQLKEVGFNVIIDQLEQAAYNERKNSGDFDALLGTGMFTWGPYPHHVKLHFSKNFASLFSNADYDALIAKSEGAPDAEKPEIYRQIQQMVLDQVPALYIVHEEKVVATSDKVMGYEMTSEDPWLELKGVTVAQ